MCRGSCAVASPSTAASPSPAPPAQDCKQALVVIRHGSDDSNYYPTPSPRQICGAGPSAPRYNMDARGTGFRSLLRERLDEWTGALGLCPIKQLSTVDPYYDYGGGKLSTVNPFWTIEGYANAHCPVAVDYFHDQTGLATDPALDQRATRVVTYTSEGMWSRIKPKFDQSYPDSDSVLRRAHAGDKYDICAPSHELVYVFTQPLAGGKWGKLEQFFSPSDTGCAGGPGACALTPVRGKNGIWCW